MVGAKYVAVNERNVSKCIISNCGSFFCCDKTVKSSDLKDAKHISNLSISL